MRPPAFLSIGTSGLVYPAAGLPLAALAAGKPLVEINPVPTPLSESVSFQLMQPSGIALPALLRALA